MIETPHVVSYKSCAPSGWRLDSSPVQQTTSKVSASPLWLLVRVNVLHSWRRLLAVREQSRLLTGVIGLFIAGYLFVSFELFFHGMKFIAKFPGLGAVLTERLMFTLFAFLFALLLLSNLVISYTNLFRNRETVFLLSLPVPAQTIFRWKFIESTVLASWAFLFLIAPLLAAFGLVRGVPWHFYMVTPLLIAMFIVLPAVLGAAVAIVVGRFLDRRSFQIALVTTGLLLLALVAFWWKATPVDDELLDKRTLEALDQLLTKTRFTMFPFLPSYWLSSAVLQWAEGILRGAAFFALVLLSHTLFFGSIAFTRFGALFYDTASAVQSRGGGGFKLGWPHCQSGYWPRPHDSYSSNYYRARRHYHRQPGHHREPARRGARPGADRLMAAPGGVGCDDRRRPDPQFPLAPLRTDSTGALRLAYLCLRLAPCGIGS